MAIYIALMVLVLIMGLLCEVSKKSILFKGNKINKQLILTISFAAMALIIGLRGPDVGEDTRHYLHIFEQSKSVQWSDMLHSTGMRTVYYTNQYGYSDTIENGFLVFCKVVHWFTDNGQFFLFVMAAITCFLFAKFIYDNCDEVFFPTYIFLCESLFMNAFNGSRQLMAGAIAIQAYTLLKKREKLFAAIVILLAALVHNVALVCFVLFPIMLAKPNKESKRFKYAVVAVVTSPFLVIVAQNIIITIFPRYTYYFSINYWTNNLGGIAVLWLLEIMFVLYMYLKKFEIKDSYALSVLTLFYLVCELMGLQITMFSRVGLFFRPCLMLMFPLFERYFRGYHQWMIRLVVMILISLLYLSYARTPVRLYHFF